MYIPGISHHIFIKVVAQPVIWLQVTYRWFYACTLAEELIFLIFDIDCVVSQNIRSDDPRAVNSLSAPSILCHLPVP